MTDKITIEEKKNSFKRIKKIDTVVEVVTAVAVIIIVLFFSLQSGTPGNRLDGYVDNARPNDNGESDSNGSYDGSGESDSNGSYDGNGESVVDASKFYGTWNSSYGMTWTFNQDTTWEIGESYFDTSYKVGNWVLKDGKLNLIVSILGEYDIYNGSYTYEFSNGNKTITLTSLKIGISIKLTK